MAERNRLLMSPEDDFAYGQGISADATWRNLIPMAEFGLGMAPVSGEAMSARDAWDASGRGGNALLEGRFTDAASDYLNMGTGILGAIPGVGIVARGTKRGAAWMDRNLPEGFNRLLDYVYPSDPRNTTMIFAGPTAKTADHAALAKAQELAASGASRDDIWRETGWNVDDLPYFEIDDSAARVINNPSGETFKDFYDHPDLYAAYPDLADVRVGLIDPQEYPKAVGAYGRPTADRPEEFLFGARSLDEWSTNPTHEAAHAVQFRAGFPGGTNPMSFTDEDVAYMRQIIESTPAGKADLARIPLDQQEMFLRRQLYHRSPGEVAARNAALQRIDMSPADRRATPPWETQDVPDDQQIVRFR